MEMPSSSGGQTESAPTPPHASELVITYDLNDISDAVREDFAWMARTSHVSLATAASAQGLPPRTELVLTDDLESVVRRLLQQRAGRTHEDGGLFVAQRIGGGRVAAKTIAKDDAYDDVVIIFDSAMWRAHLERNAAERCLELSLIAHELAHTALNRIERASGVLEGVPFPSHTPREFARSLSRILDGEYRADWFADVVVGAVGKKEIDGEQVAAHIWDINGEAYMTGMRDVLTEAYQHAPVIIQDYRLQRIPLEEMWGKIVSITEGVLTAYIHARSLADSAGRNAVLDDPALRDLPFASLYLLDTVPPLANAIRDGALLMSADEARVHDAKVTTAGEGALFELWKRLGLTFRELPERSFHIAVVEPLMRAVAS